MLVNTQEVTGGDVKVTAQEGKLQLGIAHDSLARQAEEHHLAQRYKQEAQLKSGIKYDEDKPRMDLLDNAALVGIARVLGFGATKYAPNNWRNGLSYSRLIAAAYRHLGALNSGEDLDAESGLPHVDHLGCTIMFLSWMMKNKPELDDRWKI